MEDPNWLLATCAQASASIIAIIGGFYVNRVMNLYSEKNIITRELNDVENKLKFRLHALSELDKKKLKMDQEAFFEKCEADIIKKASVAFHNGEDTSKLEDYFDQYYIKNNDQERDYDELKPCFDNKVAIIRRAFLLFQANYNNLKYINENLDKFIIENNIEAEEYGIYKDVFKATIQRNEKLPNKVLGSITYINKVSSNIDKIKSIPKLQKYEKLISRKEFLELETKFLEQEKEQLECKINCCEKPKGLVWAVLIFIYFSIVGIIFPMILMTKSAARFTDTCKYTVIGLFISGIVLVFTYLIVSTRHINKKH